MSKSVETLDKVSTLTRVFMTLEDEIQAISRYSQRLALEENDEARELLVYVRDREFRNASVSLELLTRLVPEWKKILQAVLFQEEGSAVERVEGIPLNLETEFDEVEEPEPDPEQLLREFWTEE